MCIRDRYIGNNYSTTSYNNPSSQEHLLKLISDFCVGNLDQVKFVQGSFKVNRLGDLSKLFEANVNYF
ncbi:MAG: hypothetical protein ABL930_11320, partial [Pseudobdellovibrio sp.]